jgi:nitrogen fixation protein NifU and related proteins
MDSTSLYNDLVLEHAKHPRGKGPLEHPTHHGVGKNPSCGDAVSIQLHVRESCIVSLQWQGAGCALCMSSASLLADWAQSAPRTSSDGSLLVANVRLFLASSLPEMAEPSIGKYKAYRGVCRHPSRIKCALLPLVAFEEALTPASNNSNEQ